MSVRLLSVRFADDGTITIDWTDEADMKKEGGTIHSTYITLAGQEEPQVSYWARELFQDLDELLGHARRLVEGAPTVNIQELGRD